MAITRRQFVHQAAFAAAALYGAQTVTLDGAQRIFGAQPQNTAPPDAAKIRKLASEISGRILTPDSRDYESSRLVFNRAFDRRPALIVR